MKPKTTLLLLFSILICYGQIISQEWKNLKSYQKETGDSILQNGCWLKKDRLQKNENWKNANLFNLTVENANSKYRSIKEIRDFYVWYDQEIKKQGHEINWIKTAAYVAAKLSKVENGFNRTFIIRNKEVVHFVKKGSEKVFEFALPQLNELYFSTYILKERAAKEWDSIYGTKEQCQILEPLYKELSPKAIHKLNRIAKGKGIFSYIIRKKERFSVDINDCNTRFKYGLHLLKDESAH